MDHGRPDSDPELHMSLARVGPRLQALRQRRGLTLSAVSGRTGISRSMLSRLETGQRRPSLELLLPLARTYRVPLDDLVGAPETGDPRVRLRPQRMQGRTVIPLSREPDTSAHAWKILVSRSHATPEPRSHPGQTWIYVLSGQLRLLLGERDLVLAPGEVAEFDTATPHWFGSDGEHDAEILTILGRRGPAGAQLDPMC